jgi:hypothetical protein
VTRVEPIDRAVAAGLFATAVAVTAAPFLIVIPDEPVLWNVTGLVLVTASAVAATMAGTLKTRVLAEEFEARWSGWEAGWWVTFSVWVWSPIVMTAIALVDEVLLPLLSGKTEWIGESFLGAMLAFFFLALAGAALLPLAALPGMLAGRLFAVFVGSDSADDTPVAPASR